MIKLKLLNGKANRCGTGWVRKVELLSTKADLSDETVAAVEIRESRKECNARRYGRDSIDVVILSVEEIKELYAYAMDLAGSETR